MAKAKTKQQENAPVQENTKKVKAIFTHSLYTGYGTFLTGKVYEISETLFNSWSYVGYCKAAD